MKMTQKYSSPVYFLDIPWWVYDAAIFLLSASLAVLHVSGHLYGISLVTSLSGLGFSVIVYGSFIEPRLLKITRYALGKGNRALMITFLSDIHVGPYKGRRWVEKLVRRTLALAPDLILLGGDFLYKQAKSLPELEPLKALRAPLGVYAILGNHDEWKARKEALAWFETSGIPLVHNRSIRVEKDGASIVIAGAEDDWYGETDLAAAFKDIPSDGLALIMLHNPDLAPHAAKLLKGRAGTTVFFSGHAHGGQIRLPFWGPVMRLPHHLGRKYDRGVFDFDGIPLVLGAGAGESGPRARLFCPPEIVLVTVRY